VQIPAICGLAGSFARLIQLDLFEKSQKFDLVILHKEVLISEENMPSDLS